ncbi:hypothetical protein B0H11DRAFT_2230087 [Mycena galericulata]|nr:hypothetical protein B0H11DRAFT_2230087 [Mycena galericulata]
MATIMGESGSWSYATRLTRSSDSHSDATVQPRPTTTADHSKLKHIVEQPHAVAECLQTPNEKDTLAQEVTKILKHIEHLDSSTRHAEIPNVHPDVWNLLQSDHAESLSWKLEYLHPERLIILTYPSGVHETFNILLKPIVAIAQAPFVVGTNHDIHLPSRSSVTPDFAFGKIVKGSSIQYSVLFECAWSQLTSKLSEKIQKCLEDPVVLAVVSIEIKASKKYQTPTHAPPRPHSLVPEFPESVLQQRKLLGPVEYLGHIWGQIDDIALTIHHQGPKGVENFNSLAPIGGNTRDDDLLEVQDGINMALAKLLGKVMTRDTFTAALAGTFALDWDLFYQALDTYLVADAYDRYKAWVMAYGQSALKRSLEADDDDLDDSWASSVVERRSKKHKH